MAPRETENNAYSNFWDDKQRALWYVMEFLEWSINEEHRYAKSPNFREVCMVGQICVPTTQTSEKFHFACYISIQFYIFFPLFSKHSQEIHEINF